MSEDPYGFWGDIWGWLAGVTLGDPLLVLVLLILVLLVVAFKALPARARRGGMYGKDWPAG